MAEILEPPVAGTDAGAVAEAEGRQELPSIVAITNRHVIGGVDVSVPAEDGSRVVKLLSVNGQLLIDLDLSANVCDILATNLVAVEIIEEEGSDATGDETGTTDGA